VAARLLALAAFTSEPRSSPSRSHTTLVDATYGLTHLAAGTTCPVTTSRELIARPQDGRGAAVAE
jgi:hypothetical protein